MKTVVDSLAKHDGEPAPLLHVLLALDEDHEATEGLLHGNVPLHFLDFQEAIGSAHLLAQEVLSYPELNDFLGLFGFDVLVDHMLLAFAEDVPSEKTQLVLGSTFTFNGPLAGLGFVLLDKVKPNLTEEGIVLEIVVLPLCDDVLLYKVDEVSGDHLLHRGWQLPLTDAELLTSLRAHNIAISETFLSGVLEGSHRSALGLLKCHSCTSKPRWRPGKPRFFKSGPVEGISPHGWLQDAAAVLDGQLLKSSTLLICKALNSNVPTLQAFCNSHVT